MRKEKTPIGIIIFVIVFAIAFFLISNLNRHKEEIAAVSLLYEDVDSSLIRYAGYDEDHKVLAVELSNGTTYYYWKVPLAEWENFIASDTPDEYYQILIKDEYKSDKIK